MVSPYQTALDLGRPAPAYIPTEAVEDKERVQAYWTYDDIYFNVKEAFEALLRADEDPKSRRYIPYARAVVEATNRYLGKDLTVTYDTPPDSPADDVALDEVKTWLEALIKREAFMSKYGGMKRTMLRRGDAFLQISVDTSKPEGQRLRITELDGAQYFPIKMGNDPERIAGCYIITLLESPDGQTIVAQREWYQRILTPEDVAEVPGSQVGGIYYKVDFFESDKWDDRFPLDASKLAPVSAPRWVRFGPDAELAMAGMMLPAQITAIPVYHFPNFPTVGLFGMSILQGLETILAGIIQNATDEDMSVALAGIGVYSTDSGRPKNDKGEDVEWVIGPAAVIETQAGRKFERVQGVTTVQPFQDHIETLKSAALETSGTPDVAVGKVDVSVAESGVALSIKMAPVTAGNAEREEVLKVVLEHMLFDLLNGWAPAYEGRQPIEGFITISVSFGDPLPVDRAAVIEEMTALVEAKIVDPEYARQYLTEKLGFTFPKELGTRMAAAAAAELDAEAARLDQAAAAIGAPA